MKRSPVQIASLVVGAVFLLVGVAGFIPGLYTGNLELAGHGSGALLLGLFQVSVLHNLVHLLFGVVGLLAAKTAVGSKKYLVIGGVIYLALFVVGLFIHGTDLNFVPVNTADNYLHLVLGLGMLGLGSVLGKSVK